MTLKRKCSAIVEEAKLADETDVLMALVLFNLCMSICF